ncbi:hypothetical protein LKL35_12540 [Streptomyces sp. ET3-23]|uniref:hypothetical protein n=1 Tax=Streptomyces sp. ET3-23 TaxID=2885643 RepID=UPI001D123077|nr:hypothetical protein [Streptomyces sp. ET3-23]MCC2276235.1 hypothetical protein [Streptomyces sp. ET3-23]
MAFTDHHAVFVGSTDDGHTFIVLNQPIRSAHRILTTSGFTTREHQGRTLYLLPPNTSSEEAHNRTGEALHELLAHTMDFVDLSWTTRYLDAGPVPKAVVHFDLSNGHVTATTHTQAADDVLEQHGFTPTPAGYTLPSELGERECVGAVARAEAHLWSIGLASEARLGLPTPEAITAAPGRTRAATPTPPTVPTHQRRTR